MPATGLPRAHRPDEHRLRLARVGGDRWHAPRGGVTGRLWAGLVVVCVLIVVGLAQASVLNGLYWLLFGR